jgi:hypothetical protein
MAPLGGVVDRGRLLEQQFAAGECWKLMAELLIFE